MEGSAPSWLIGPTGDVMVTVEDVDGKGFDREVRDAQPVLDSLSFVP